MFGVHGLLLQERGARAQAASPDDLEGLLALSPGVLVVTHEALDPKAIGTIGVFLQAQPKLVIRLLFGDAGGRHGAVTLN
ncbi:MULTISPECIES: hypothetical protein [unclassified Mesorhizobium]|uniref:hypothetical protein n=1 Tax=unclassified Mesorhizobium TaxID=325217 RepID=UPI0015E46E62|nr:MULTISPECIES: hypothetical protein [unclassified Mesorhizobium]MBZ9898273.1 hypothetical protein [Mesorhizobium sp. BR1-1-6]